jgi:hypothetical protein
MPAPELDYRFQKAQLWQRTGNDEYGNPLLSGREEVKVRWERKELQMIGPDGQPIKIDVLVIAVIEIPNGSIMWEGKQGDLPNDITTITNLMEVVAYDKIPDVKGRIVRRTYGLKRYNDKLPTVVS